MSNCVVPNVNALDWKPIHGYPLEFAVENVYIESMFPLKFRDEVAYIRCIGSDNLYTYSKDMWHTLRDLYGDVSTLEKLIDAYLEFNGNLKYDVDGYLRPRMDLQ